MLQKVRQYIMHSNNKKLSSWKRRLTSTNFDPARYKSKHQPLCFKVPYEANTMRSQYIININTFKVSCKIP